MMRNVRMKTALRSRAIFLTAILVLSLASCGCDKTPLESASVESAQAPLVQAVPIVEQEVKPKFLLVGTVIATRRAVVGSPVSERVEEVAIDIGDEVRSISAGSDPGSGGATRPMVRLNTDVIDLRIAAAKAELARLTEVLRQLQRGNRPEEIARAKAQLEAAKATSRLTAARRKRAEQLSQVNSISEDELEAAQAADSNALHRLAAAEADLALMMAGPRKEEIAQAEAQVDIQRQELARLDVTRRRHLITAPFDGFVVRRLTDVGEWLAVGDPVAELVALDPIGVRIHVPEDLVNQLKLGDKVPLHIAALPAGERDLNGVIRGIAPSADPRAKTFVVRVRVDNPKRDGQYLLRDGMQARATAYGEPRKAIVIPKDALVLGDATPYVMVVRELDNGKLVAARVDVHAGAAHGKLIEVTGPLEPSQLVIVRGNGRLQAGQEVRLAAGGAPSP